MPPAAVQFFQKRVGKVHGYPKTLQLLPGVCLLDKGTSETHPKFKIHTQNVRQIENDIALLSSHRIQKRCVSEQARCAVLSSDKGKEDT